MWLILIKSRLKYSQDLWSVISFYTIPLRFREQKLNRWNHSCRKILANDFAEFWVLRWIIYTPLLHNLFVRLFQLFALYVNSESLVFSREKNSFFDNTNFSRIMLLLFVSSKNVRAIELVSSNQFRFLHEGFMNPKRNVRTQNKLLIHKILSCFTALGSY